MWSTLGGARRAGVVMKLVSPPTLGVRNLATSSWACHHLDRLTWWVSLTLSSAPRAAPLTWLAEPRQERTLSVFQSHGGEQK